MPDLRFKKNSALNRPSFSSFSVKKDGKQGFKAELNWEYFNPKIIGFKIYRTVLPESILEKKYTINQRILELYSPASSPRWNNNILYNKNFFSFNSKVKLAEKDDSRHLEIEKRNSDLTYEYWGFTRVNLRKKYKFIDTSVKFGKSYGYIITAITERMQETPFGTPLIINIEDLSPPVNLFDFYLSEVSGGILVSIVFENKNDVAKYKIFKRKVGEVSFSETSEGVVNQSHISFLDGDVEPGNEYEYKVYLVDLYGNISWSSEKKKVEFLSNFLKKGAIIDPIVKITYEDPSIKIKGFKNSERVVGYRVEKMNISRKEKGFSIGSYKDGTPWPYVFFFDDSEEMELDDFNLNPLEIYKYRISSISITGKTESILVTPPFYGQDASFDYDKFPLKDPVSPVLNNFDVKTINSKQKPIYTKFSWKISGDWSFLVLKIGEFTIKIDSVHDHIYFDKLESGREYTVYLDLYDINENIVTSKRVSRIIL